MKIFSKLHKLMASMGLAATMVGCAVGQPQIKDAPVPKGAAELVVGGGCFWCVEAVLEDLKGVYAVESGYAGGPANASYSNMGRGAEVVKVFYDSKKVSAEDLLRAFFVSHDPTTLNRQGPDTGTQYRSVVFYASEAERARARKIIGEVAKVYSNPIVTTLEPLKNYVRAEEYHQNYYQKFEKATPEQRASMNAGYCTAIIEPKVRKFRERYFEKLKKG
jgi:methionine-S-sulfoxide reductase